MSEAALLIDVLQKTISQNADDQKRALDFLGQASAQNFPVFVHELSAVLHNTQCEGFVRQAAGLQLKNVLYAKDDETRTAYLKRWVSLPEDVRRQVKEKVVRTLGTEPFRPSIAAQCVAAIACAELPSGLWNDVISLLMANVTNAASTEMLKEASLETLGYICQDIDPRVLEIQANAILTAIVHGMRKDEPSRHVRLAATNALQNSLEFTNNNFKNDPERHIIMQVVCETTQYNETQVQVAALQCLVRIMSLYYQYMETYMGTALFPISVAAMKSNEADVALQGIEFWSNVCEEEITLSVEAEEAAENNRAPEHVSRHYARGAVSHLCPILLETLAKQDDADDEDDWTPAKAAGVCIMLLAQCVGDAILECVSPFFTHFSSSNWKYKEAAIMAFGSILDGPDPQKLMPLVEQAMPLLVASMNERSVNVRDTTAWAIGRVIEVCGDVISREGVLARLLPALSSGLQQEPRVATNVCWALISLVKAAYDIASASGTDSTGQPDTYLLSVCFQPMIAELVKTTDRPDGNQSNLRISAFETLMELIKNSPKDCYPVVQETTIIMLQKLEQIINMEASATSTSDKNQLVELQAMLCATLQSVMRKMRAEDAPMVGQHIMNGLLQIMSRANVKGSNVMDEALLAVSALVETLGQNFAGYLEVLKPHLLRGLSSFEEPPVCNAAVGVVIDLCRSLESNIAPILDDVMQILVTALQNPKVSRDVRVTILGCFGDIAIAIGTHFDRYEQIVMQLLNQAAMVAIVTDPNDMDQVDYVDKLRENCILAYTGIFQGLRVEENQPNWQERSRQSIAKHAQSMCEMILRCCDMQPVPPTDTVLAAMFGLIGDLVGLYGAQIMPVLNNEKVSQMLARGRKSKSSKTKTMATWATKEMRKVPAQ